MSNNNNNNNNDNIDYTFMKTGYSITGDERRQLTEEQVRNIEAMILVFTANAIETSFLYVDHSTRNGVTCGDINLALKYEVFKFIDRPNIQEQINITSQILEEEEEEEEEVEEEEEEEEEEEGEVEKFVKNNCTCDICAEINSIDNKWEEWNPEEPFLEKLKERIDDIPI